MNENGISPISGLVMRGHQNTQHGFKIYEDRMPSGAYTMWGANIPFNAEPNDYRPRPILTGRPCAVANLDLTKAERDKLRAYAYGLVVKGHLEATRGLTGTPSKFCLFATKEEYDALEAGERETPFNYNPILLDDLWRDAQRLSLTQKADQTLLNLSYLETLPTEDHYLFISVKPPKELNPEEYEHNQVEEEIKNPHGIVFAAVEGERAIVLAILHEEGLISLGDSVTYKDEHGNSIGKLPRPIRITAKGYLRIEELLKGRGRREAFLICRFKEPLDTLYRVIYQVVGNDPEVNCPIIRVKDEDHNDQIDDRIIYKINHATVIVVDLSGGKGEDACTNFNVAFEAGYALSLGKPIIWTLDKAKWPKNDKLPFDIQNQNVLVYEHGKLDEFRERLKFRMLAAVDKAGGIP